MVLLFALTPQNPDFNKELSFGDILLLHFFVIDIFTNIFTHLFFLRIIGVDVSFFLFCRLCSKGRIYHSND